MSDASWSTPESIYYELSRLVLALDELSRAYQELLTRTTRMVLDRSTGTSPGDYMDYAAADYDAWLQNLAEEDGGGSRGAPPAAISAIEALETFEVGSSEMMNMDCAVCKDALVMGEIGKKLPCGHSYHGDCILPWLRTRNSCPLCRFQLQTDDPEYESMKR